MTSRSSSPQAPGSDDDSNDLFRAMDAPSSPIAPVPSSSAHGKRAHKDTEDDDPNSDENLPSNPNHRVATNINARDIVKRYAVHKKLRSEQQTEVMFL